MKKISAPLLLAYAVLLVVSACDADPEASAEDVAEIERVIRGYLPLMADAYESGDLEPLAEFASQKEVASVDKKVHDLWDQEGRYVDAELVDLEVEDVNVWNYSNAFVTTVEVWDLRVRLLGSDTQTSEALGQKNRVRYQLKRRGDTWSIMGRTIESTFE